MCGGMPSQVMGPQMDADQLTGIVNHCSGTLVGQRENALIRANSFLFDVSLEPISNLLRDKNDLGLNCFLSIGVLQGFSSFGSTVFLMKLKKDARQE